MAYVLSTLMLIALCSTALLVGRRQEGVTRWGCALMFLVAVPGAVYFLYEAHSIIDTGIVHCKRALPCTRADAPADFWFAFVATYAVGVMAASFACVAVMRLFNTTPRR